MGAGRLKLLKLHLEECVDSQDDPPSELQEYLSYLDGEVNREIGEEWQNISIEATFSGVSARDMAIEVGMDGNTDSSSLRPAPRPTASGRAWIATCWSAAGIRFTAATGFRSGRSPLRSTRSS